MKTICAFWLGLMYSLCFSQDNLRDIKFYNLEKEYTKTVTYVYKVNNASALELKQIVKDMLSIFGSLYVNENSNELYITDTEEKIADLKSVIPGLDIKTIKAGNNLVSKFVYLKHENVSEVTEIIKHKLSVDGSIHEVPTQNALVVTDIASKIEEVEDLLKKIDSPGAHISIEITIIEFNSGYFSRLGINVFNWLQGLSIGASAGVGEPGRAHINLSAGGAAATKAEQIITTSTDAAGAVNTVATNVGKNTFISANLNVGDIAGFINENADGAVLASTRLITRNNKEASINAKEFIPYRFSEPGRLEPFGYSNLTMEGIGMRVTPTLQQDSLINLKIYPSIIDLTGWAPNGLPMVFERSLNTEVKVPNDNILVLGGLKRKDSDIVRRGIPLLKDIPILGYLFSIKQTIVTEKEVLIFIRPSTQVSASVSEQDFHKLMEKYKNESK